jgi:hypothetical protein
VHTDALRRSPWTAATLFVAGLVALYAGALAVGFQNDDYLFLEQARRFGMLGAFEHPSGLANYFRPLSREAWFALLAPLSGGEPLGFHLAQLLVFVAALVLLADLLRAFVPARPGGWLAVPVLAGVLWYAVLPFQRVNLMWVSCVQDLLALTGALGAIALFRRGRDRLAALAFLAATLAKQSALPLPVMLFVWSWRIDGDTPRRAFTRVWPAAVALLPWVAGEWWLRQHSPGPARLEFDASHLAAAFAHLPQALAGIEHAAGWLASWGEARPSVLAFALVALVARWLPAAPAAAASADPPAIPARRAVGFAILWCLVFTLPLWPVAYSWSGYYYTLAAVGGAVLVALAAVSLTRWRWVLFAGVLLWWHAAGVAPAAFAQREDAWTGTSHITSHYIERATSLSAAMRASLVRTLPKVGQGTRFFFATLPSWAGFQMGNGPSVRHLYHDDSIESWFYSEYSESTAARHPVKFLYWDGAEFAPLYAGSPDPLFQVGGDLLLLDHPAGAVWAFRRGLEEGGERLDHWYWLGWAELWSGHRTLAERAWSEWGAHDDSTARILWLRKARGSLLDGDTLKARRELIEAVRTGIGYPESHAMLGLLLQRVNAKYALLETRVAVELKPRDWLARRDLVEGLVAARLDPPAARQLAELQKLLPRWQEDTVVVRLVRQLEERRPAPGSVASFTPGGLR